MNFVSILLTAFALSMDAFAVSVTKGMTLKNLTKGIAIKIAFFFGLFQGGMPLLGWVLGISFEEYIKSIDHWIALILLSILGFNMIHEFIKERNEEDDFNNSETSVTLDDGLDENNLNRSCFNKNYSLSNKELITLSIATSIDALAIGINFAFLNVDIISSSLIIAIITFIMCFIGVVGGKKLGNLFKNYAELVGGLILIFIGINIFNEHTNFISNLINSVFKSI